MTSFHAKSRNSIVWLYHDDEMVMKVTEDDAEEIAAELTGAIETE